MQIRSTIWLDANGYTQIGMLRTNTGAGAIQAAIAAVSNAGLQQCWEGSQTVTGAAPTAALYQSGQQIVRLTFLCADGSEAVVKVFAPQSTIFLTDGVTVDPANANVATLIAACIGNLESATGALATAFLSGYMEGLLK